MPLCLIYLTISEGGDFSAATVSDLSDSFCICTLPQCLIYMTIFVGGDLYAATVYDLSDYFCRRRSVHCN